MILYIVRHAWAEEHDNTRWPDDGERPLTEAGIKRFRRVAKRLVKRDVRPQSILTSPLVRCTQTAALLAERLNGVTPQVIGALAPGSAIEHAIEASTDFTVEELAWVAHAPDVGRWVASLIGGAGGYVEMAKGAVAMIEFDDQIVLGRGRLEWLATAKVLGC
jgi:phosphohistidine phosphatase